MYDGLEVWRVDRAEVLKGRHSVAQLGDLFEEMRSELVLDAGVVADVFRPLRVSHGRHMLLTQDKVVLDVSVPAMRSGISATRPTYSQR